MRLEQKTRFYFLSDVCCSYLKIRDSTGSRLGNRLSHTDEVCHLSMLLLRWYQIPLRLMAAVEYWNNFFTAVSNSCYLFHIIERGREFKLVKMSVSCLSTSGVPNTRIQWKENRREYAWLFLPVNDQDSFQLSYRRNSKSR